MCGGSSTCRTQWISVGFIVACWQWKWCFESLGSTNRICVLLAALVHKLVRFTTFAVLLTNQSPSARCTIVAKGEPIAISAVDTAHVSLQKAAFYVQMRYLHQNAPLLHTLLPHCCLKFAGRLSAALPCTNFLVSILVWTCIKILCASSKREQFRRYSWGSGSALNVPCDGFANRPVTIIAVKHDDKGVGHPSNLWARTCTDISSTKRTGSKQPALQQKPVILYKRAC